jgi:DNA-binding transcriptional LysR family regulator
MNDRQLRYAVKVRDELSFSRAAEKLRLSQSAISEQINMLETELGFPLFRRAGRGVEVTQAGQIFLHEAEETLVSFASLQDLGRQLSHGSSSRFSVGITPGATHLVIPLIAKTLRPILPDIHLSITTAIAPQLQRLVMQHVLDIGISMQISPRSTHAALVWDSITTLELALFVPPGHRLAKRRSVMLEDIAHDRFIICEPTLGYGALVQSMFSDCGLRPNVVGVANHTNVLKMMICSGIGIGILPAATVESEISTGQLNKVALRPTRTISLYVVSSSKPLNAHAENAVALIKDAMRRELCGGL